MMLPNLVIISLCLILSGCIQVLPDPGEPPKIIELQPTVELKQDLPFVGWQLGVEEPFADPVLNSVKIPLKIHSEDKGGYFSYVNGKEWRTRLPLMIETLMIKAFEASGKVRGVARMMQGLKFDHILITDLGHCEFNLSERQKVVTANIQLTAKVMLMPERKIIATRTFHETALSPTQEFPAMLMALENAAGKLLADLTVWVLEQTE